MESVLEAFFLPGSARAGGQRLAVFRAPAGPVRAAVLCLPAFAEELNKTRRMTALAASALASAGFACLHLDLLGCGDSTGDFADAGWSDWLDDVTSAVAWLRQRSAAPLWLWSTRGGCLLAADAARQLAGPLNLMFWQPQTSGKQVLQQFLRLKMAGQLSQGAAKGVTTALLEQLARGQAVDVAGYGLSPALAEGLQQASLQNPPQPQAGAHLVWLEVHAGDDAQFTPAAAAVQSSWESAGYRLQRQIVKGLQFWQTTDLEEVPELVQATREALLRAHPLQA